MPLEATQEREYFLRVGLKSNVTIPLMVMGTVVGGIGFSSFRSQRRLPDELIPRLRQVGDIFTNALARKRADEALNAKEHALRLFAFSGTRFATIFVVFYQYFPMVQNMKNSPLPLSCSVVSNAERSYDFDGKPPTDLRSLAIQSLEDNPIFRGRLALGAIQIESDGDTLVLFGCVPSYYLKQLLQETLRHVEGVGRIKNHVEVVNPSGLLPAN